MRHFNAGHVFGKIRSFTEHKGKHPHVSIEIQTGPVLTTAKIWGAKLMTAFVADMKSGMVKEPLHLAGVFTQYRDRTDKLHSEFNILNWCVDAEQEPRAAFVLVGRLVAKAVSKSGLPVIKIEVSGKMNKTAFAVYGADKTAFDCAAEGDDVSVKGYVRHRVKKGSYGTPEGPVLPFCEEVKKG